MAGSLCSIETGSLYIAGAGAGGGSMWFDNTAGPSGTFKIRIQEGFLFLFLDFKKTPNILLEHTHTFQFDITVFLSPTLHKEKSSVIKCN